MYRNKHTLLLPLFTMLAVAYSSLRVTYTQFTGNLSFVPKAQATSETEADFTDRVVRVGIQVGHWQNAEVPPELYSIKGNTGAQAENGYTELESNFAIATQVAKTLTEQGIAVDILPTTVPINYTADAFITIHADGSHNPETTGYKVASYAKDATGSAAVLSDFIDTAYSQHTQLAQNAIITRNMTHYYAFSADRFQHAVSRTTPAVIVETGFITNSEDQDLLIHNTHIPATGIAQGIIQYLVHTQPEVLISSNKLISKQT